VPFEEIHTILFAIFILHIEGKTDGRGLRRTRGTPHLFLVFGQEGKKENGQGEGRGPAHHILFCNLFCSPFIPFLFHYILPHHPQWEVLRKIFFCIEKREKRLYYSILLNCEKRDNIPIPYWDIIDYWERIVIYIGGKKAVNIIFLTSAFSYLYWNIHIWRSHWEWEHMHNYHCFWGGNETSLGCTNWGKKEKIIIIIINCHIHSPLKVKHVFIIATLRTIIHLRIIPPFQFHDFDSNICNIIA